MLFYQCRAKGIIERFKGKPQCGGLWSYKTAFKNNDEVTLLACLAHIRRGFFKAKKNNLALSRYFLNETRIIYDIEAYCDYKSIGDAQRAAIRKKHIRPILDAMEKWLLENKPPLIPDSGNGMN